MATLNVQFSDATDSAIVAYFSSEQDADVVSNLGTIDSSDAIWKTFFDASPIMLQQSMPQPD